MKTFGRECRLGNHSSPSLKQISDDMAAVFQVIFEKYPFRASSLIINSITTSGEARRKWMVVPITDLRTLKIYPKRQLDNYTFDRNGKVVLLENDHKNDGN